LIRCFCGWPRAFPAAGARPQFTSSPADVVPAFMNPRPLLLASLVFAGLISGSASAQNTYPFPSSGNVGIGTITPQSKLHLFSAGQVELRLQNNSRQWAILSNESWGAGGLSLYDITTDVSRLQISANGNVGIGTVSPHNPLSVAGPFTPGWMQLSIQAAGADDRAGVSFWNAAGVRMGGLYMGEHASILHQDINQSLDIYTGGNLTLRVAANGNVGVGTSSPGHRFTVAGGSLMVHTGAEWDNVQISTDGVHAYLEANGDEEGFFIKSNTGGKVIFPSGNVGIGTTSPTHKLAVNGTIKAKEVIVETTGWSDYVFAEDYALTPLAEVEAHIKEHKHLPGIPSAAQVAANGVSLGDVQAALLAKIEELTLHAIAQEKRSETQAREIAELKTQNAMLLQMYGRAPSASPRDSLYP
jgi:hypothetical protein